MSENNSNGKLIYFSRIKYDVLVYICNFIKKNSYSPTQKEISKNSGLVEQEQVRLLLN